VRFQIFGNSGYWQDITNPTCSPRQFTDGTPEQQLMMRFMFYCAWKGLDLRLQAQAEVEIPPEKVHRSSFYSGQILSYLS
jgi:hypothetical protein